MGQSPKGTTYNSQKIGVPFYQGKAEFGEIYPTVRKWTTAPKKIAEKGDVLLSVRAPVGPTNLCTETSCIGRGLAAVRPLEGYDSKYILYAIRATVNTLAAKGTGSTFDAVSGSDVRAHQISLPEDVSRQGQIVEEIEKQFSRLDAGVAALKRAQANLKRYRASVLKAACEGNLVPTEAELARQEGRTYETGAQLLERILKERRANWQGRGAYKEPVAPDTTGLPDLPEGWVWANLGQMGQVGTGATPKRGTSAYYDEGIYPWLTSGALNANYVETATEFVTETALKRTNLTLYPPGTLLVAMYGEGRTRGTCSELRISATTNQAIAAIVVPLVIRRFVKLSILSMYEKLRGAAIGGVQPNLNLSLVKQAQIALPPLSELQRIVMEVDRILTTIDLLSKTVNQDMVRAARLRQAILANAFHFP